MILHCFLGGFSPGSKEIGCVHFIGAYSLLISLRYGVGTAFYGSTSFVFVVDGFIFYNGSAVGLFYTSFSRVGATYRFARSR